MPHLDLSPPRPLSSRIHSLADALADHGDEDAAAEVREVAQAYRERLADGDVMGALAAFARLHRYHGTTARRDAN